MLVTIGFHSMEQNIIEVNGYQQVRRPTVLMVYYDYYYF